MASFLPAQRYAIALLAMALCLCLSHTSRCCTETDGRIELFFCMKASTSPPLRCRVIRKNLENNGTSVLNFVPNSGLSAKKLTGTSSVAACYQFRLTVASSVKLSWHYLRRSTPSLSHWSSRRPHVARVYMRQIIILVNFGPQSYHWNDSTTESFWVGP